MSEAEAERDRIVKWMRGLPTNVDRMSQGERGSRAYRDIVDAIDLISAAIQRGDHLR